MALDGRHLEAHLAERRRHLGADEAEADHHRPGAGAGRAANAVAILHRAQLEYAREIRTGGGERSVPTARRDQEPVVGHLLAPLQADDFALGIDRDGADTQTEVDVLLRVVVRRVDELILEPVLAAKIALGQRRAIVGELRLGADEIHGAVVAALAQRRGGTGAGQ